MNSGWHSPTQTWTFPANWLDSAFPISHTILYGARKHKKETSYIYKKKIIKQKDFLGIKLLSLPDSHLCNNNSRRLRSGKNIKRSVISSFCLEKPNLSHNTVRGLSQLWTVQFCRSAGKKIIKYQKDFFFLGHGNNKVIIISVPWVSQSVTALQILTKITFR